MTRDKIVKTYTQEYLHFIVIYLLLCRRWLSKVFSKLSLYIISLSLINQSVTLRRNRRRLDVVKLTFKAALFPGWKTQAC